MLICHTLIRFFHESALCHWILISANINNSKTKTKSNTKKHDKLKLIHHHQLFSHSNREIELFKHYSPTYVERRNDAKWNKYSIQQNYPFCIEHNVFWWWCVCVREYHRHSRHHHHNRWSHCKNCRFYCFHSLNFQTTNTRTFLYLFT